MSDLSYLHEKPVLVYGGTEAGDLFTVVDTSDGNRIKVVTQEDLIKIILGGKTLGGTGSGDVTTNNASQTITNKILIDPSIRYTPNGGGTVVEIDNEEVGTLVANLKAGGVEDGVKLVEIAENIRRQTFCALIDSESSDPGKTIGLTAADLFAASDMDGSKRTIDVRSLTISAWVENEGDYIQKYDWSAVSTVTSGFAMDKLTLTMNDAATVYSLAVHFRLIEA